MPDIKEEYVKYLIVSPLNQTQTYMGEHHVGLSHEQVNRFMRVEKLRPRHLWQAVKGDVVASEQGYLLFDDTVIDKDHSEKIEMAQKQYSGNAHGLVVGIAVVNCVYYNPETNQFWVIDYRIYNPIADGRDKLEHMEAMLKHTMEWKKLAFRGVLMDTWYAPNHLMKVIADLKKFFYCPVQENRSVHQGMHWTTPKHFPTPTLSPTTSLYHPRPSFAVRVIAGKCAPATIAPRNQAAYCFGTVPMPQSPSAAEPYRLCKSRLGYP